MLVHWEYQQEGRNYGSFDIINGRSVNLKMKNDEETGVLNDEKKLFTTAIEDMPGLSFICSSCGRRHSVDIEKLVVRSNILDELVKGIMPFKNGRLLVISDNNTYEVLGRTVQERLEKEGFSFKSFMFETEGHNLLPDERSIGRLLFELEQETSLILAVGSGVLNDLARFIAYRTNKPFAIAATAPSMDGYASIGSPLIIGKKKITPQCKYPYGIFADTSIMKDAPLIMIKAGFGDVLGKLTAIADWQLAKIIENEYYCETSVKLVQKGVEKCIESVDGLLERKDEAIKHLIEALILTGVAMGLVGMSRPASGTEHQLAHYWEIKAIEAGREHPLHGNAVGTCTLITAMLYEMAAADGLLPEGLEYPALEEVRDLLEKVGAETNPGGLNIDRDMFVDGMLNAMNFRKKYTILQFLSDRGKLEEYTNILTRRFYE